MARKKSILSTPDPILLGICLVLSFVGLLILASVSASFSLQKAGSTFFYLNHQIMYGLVPGTIAALVLYFISIDFFRRWSLPVMIGAILFLSLVFIPSIGGSSGGAQRWIFLGGFSFQPAEVLKVAFILYAAAWLTSRVSERSDGSMRSKKKSNDAVSIFLPFMVICSFIAGLLLLQPDMSTLGVIAGTAFVMYFISGTPLWHMVFMTGGAVAAFVLMIRMAPYRMSRWTTFLNPNEDPLGQGLQLKQSLIGIGSGGLLGAGVSFQKFGFLPEPMSDSVFAVFAEEMGFVGAIFLILLFALFAWRGFWVARNVTDRFSSLVAVGVTTWITLQALVHMGALTGLLPLTGIPLPFTSYGGSSMIAVLMGVGILLNISKQTVYKEK